MAVDERDLPLVHRRIADQLADIDDEARRVAGVIGESRRDLELGAHALAQVAHDLEILIRFGVGQASRVRLGFVLPEDDNFGSARTLQQYLAEREKEGKIE